MPLDVLKSAYEAFGSDCEDDEWQNQDVAMVAKEKGKNADTRGCSSALSKEIQSSPDNSQDTQPVVLGSPPRKKRRIDVDPVDTEDEDKLCNDTCGCDCGCRLFPNHRPMMKCMNCQEAICSGCRHVGS